MKTLLLIAISALIPSLSFAQGCEEEVAITNLKCENAIYSLRISTTADLTPTLTLKAKATNELSVLSEKLVGIESNELKITSDSPCKSSISSGNLFLVACTKNAKKTSVEFIDANGGAIAWTKGPAINFEVSQKRSESARGIQNEVELEVNFYKDAKEKITFDLKDCYSF